MLQTLQSALETPTLSDPERQTQAHLLNSLLLLGIGWNLVTVLPTLAVTTQSGLVLIVYIVTLALLIYLKLYRLNRGYVRQTSIILIVGLWIIVTGANLYRGGLESPGLVSYAVLIIMSGLLLGEIPALIAIGVSVATLPLIYWATALELVPISEITNDPASRAMIIVAQFMLVGLLIYVGIRRLRQALQNERILKTVRHEYEATAWGKNYVDNILNSMSNLLLVLDSARLIKDINPAATHILGYHRAELIGQPFSKIVVGDQGILNNDIEISVEDPTRDRQFEFRAKDGRHVPVNFTLSVMRDTQDLVTGVVCVAQDISERRAAEIERGRNELRYRALFQQTTDAIMLISTDGQVLDVNRRTAELLGYSTDELKQMSYLDMIADSEKVFNQDIFERVVVGDYMPLIERRVFLANGRSFDAEVQIDLVRDADGIPIHIQVVIRDITERKKAESDVKYHAQLLETISDAVISIDMKNCIKSWNRAAELVYGWTAEEVIGRQLEDIIPMEFEDGVNNFIQSKYVNRGYWSSQVTQRRRSGEELVVMSSVALVRDENNMMIGAVMVNHDITKREAAERKLEETVIQLSALRQVEGEANSSLDINQVLQVTLNAASILSNADAGFLLLQENGSTENWQIAQTIGDYEGRKLDGNAIAASDIMQRVIHNEEPEFISQAEPGQDHPPLPETEALIVLPLIAKNRSIGVLNLETRSANHFTPQVFEFLHTLFAPRLAAAMDNARLYQLARRQLDDLRELYEQVMNLEMIKTEMIHIANHDLRTPTSVIKQSLEIMAMESMERFQEDDLQYLSLIKNAAQQLHDRIADLLSLDRVPELQSLNQVVDLHLAANHVYRESESQAHIENLHLVNAIIENEVCVQGDRVLLHEAMYNYLSNAFKYTPKGGTITIQLLRKHDEAYFAVKDTGYGIPKDQQPFIFQQEYRAKTAETENIEGTGKGLIIVKNIIQRHRGQVGFTSEYGQGSTFWFTLPLYDEADD